MIAVSTEPALKLVAQDFSFLFAFLCASALKPHDDSAPPSALVDTGDLSYPYADNGIDLGHFSAVAAALSGSDFYDGIDGMESVTTLPKSSFAFLLIVIAVGSFGATSRSLDAAEPPPPERPERIYLDEFRPTSSLKVEEHLLTRAKFPCVNVHSHPGRLTRAELDEMVQVMDEANIAVSVSLDGGLRGAKFVNHYYELTQAYPDRFAVFLWIDYVGDGDPANPSTWDVHRPGYGLRMADKLTEAVKQGACGMKVWKDLGLYMRGPDGKLIMPDDPRFDPLWERAAELKIPIVWHCADPRAFFTPTDAKNERWEELYRHPEWSFHGKDFPSHQELMDARNRVIAKHTDTVFICAHMAEQAEDLKQLSQELDRYPNMNVEIAARVSELGRQPYSSRKFFVKYADRILFGTDGIPPMTELIPHFRFLETWDEYFPYEDNPFPPQGLWNIYGLGLPDPVLKKIYYENAGRLIPGVAEKVAKYSARNAQARAPGGE